MAHFQNCVQNCDHVVTGDLNILKGKEVKFFLQKLLKSTGKE
jgi:hypothetical protein